jgi:hypothetical protein
MESGVNVFNHLTKAVILLLVVNHFPETIVFWIARGTEKPSVKNKQQTADETDELNSERNFFAVLVDFHLMD